MAYYYSASERAFFSSDIVSTGSMPADKVAVTTEKYQQLMADQVSGMLIRPGSGNAPESASQKLSAANRFGNVSFGTVTATGLDVNGNSDISGTLVVGGATTLKGALAAQAGITTTTITATGTTTLAALNATNITASGTLTVNGNSTLKALSATNISASGTLKVTGATTLTGKLTANGGLDTKALTATSFNVTGNASVGGLLSVTGDIKGRGFVDTENSSGKGFRLIDSRLDLVDGQSYQIQDWPVRVVDKDGRTAAMVKYYNNSDGSSAIVLADVSYSSEDDQSGNWAQVTIGHKSGGTPFLETALPTSLKGGLAVSGGDLTVAGAATFTNGLTVSGARAIFNHDIDANGALSVTKTLTAKGALAVTGAAAFSGTVTASKAIRSTDSLSAPMLYLGGTGAHIVRQLTNITKGTAPSSTVYVGNFLYPSGSTNAVSNRIAGNEIAIGTGGITTYTFTCYENAASSTNAASLRLGYAGEPYINLSADNINVSGMLNTSQGITSAKGIAVQTGNISCTSGTFVGNSTVNFAHNDTIIVNGQGSGSDQQRWPLAVYDKNGNSLAYCKFLQTAAGQNRWQFLVAYRNSSGSNTMAGLEVRNDTSGNFYTTAVTPAKDSNGTDIATTEWVRAYNWDATRGQIVHTVNDETISGTKTFTNAIRGGAITLIQTTPWEDVSIADTSRTATATRMLAVVQDKDNKRFAGLEVSALSDGKRYLHVTMRRRDDSGWVSPFKAVEMVDGTTYCEGAHHPPAGDVSYKFATTGWVEDRIGSTIPAGAICYFAQKSIPSGWLLCNGSNVSRTTYARLFAAIGTSWGSGDGSTTFKLPNLHAKFAQGTTTTSEVGQSVEAGLPNITGQITSYELGRAGGAAAGALYDDGSAKYGVSRDSGSGNHDGQSLVITLEASRSSSIYGGSTTVQPPAVKLLPCIKY